MNTSRTDTSAPSGYGNKPDAKVEAKPEVEVEVEVEIAPVKPVVPPEPIVTLREIAALLEVLVAQTPSGHHLAARIAALRASLG